MRLIEFDVWTTTEDLETNEYLQSCETVNDFEMALEACYETEEEAVEAAAEQRQGATDEGLPATSRPVRLRVTLERTGRRGPVDFEL